MARWYVKMIDIGNSSGIRIPRALMEKYGWGESLVLEETEHGVLLSETKTSQLSWNEAYRAMAAENEDWTDLEVTDADGLE